MKVSAAFLPDVYAKFSRKAATIAGLKKIAAEYQSEGKFDCILTGCYTNNLMNMSRHTTLAVSILFSIGLLCAQFCTSVCAFSMCTALSNVSHATSSQESGHCHQDKSEQKSPLPDRSHECPSHDAAFAAPSSADFHVDQWQPAPPVVLDIFWFVNDLFPSSDKVAVTIIPCESPPEPATSRPTILRV